VPVDRHTTLRRAEQYLLQGKHALAIDEYLRVLEDQPRDWATTNTLGDLYVRDHQHAMAVEQFVRSADGLFADGFITRAAALYRKALRFDPGQTHALARLAEAASAQGLIADACTYLQQAIEASRARDDVEGFERAAEAAAPSEAEGSRLLYDLAGALEAAGEAACALAVYLELQIAAGPYLDVAERVHRLAVVESGE
jgi:tetratricopeptide (TPR) repeat protein